MPEEVWKIFVGLGVPGLALGIFYALLRVFSWDLSILNPILQVGLAVLFLLIVSGITLIALRLWRPNLQARSKSSVRIGARSTVGSSIAGRDLKQGSTHPENSDISKLNSESSVEIGSSASISGAIAGRDILINYDRLPDRTEELSKILEDRARRINVELEHYFHFVPVQEFLNSFNHLHIRHLEALQQGQLIYAHEILNEIHQLSFKLQNEELWSERKSHRPKIAYSPGGYQSMVENLNYHSQRGRLIKWYVGSQAMEELVAAKEQGRLRSQFGKFLGRRERSISKIYLTILSANNQQFL
jgi:hypothetical protein